MKMQGPVTQKHLLNDYILTFNQIALEFHY
jgi:hypothetical protein